MSPDFENMMYLFGCGARGKAIDIKHCVNLGNIRKIALSQGIWDVIYSALREKIKAGDIKIPEEIKAQLERNFVTNVAVNIQKTEFTQNILEKIKERGIDCCILKGTTVSRLYATPEARISSDTDIIIKPDKENQVVQILKENGYSVEERAKNDHHRKAVHPLGGLLEVHIALYSKITKEILFENKCKYDEPYQYLASGECTLGLNDNLMYLTIHLIKHLINGGVGVRQMMDLLLYMKEYENQLDWRKYNTIIKELRYSKVINVIKGIGVKYFSMEFKDADMDEEAINAILTDAETGGVFGYGEKKRASFLHEYVQRRANYGNLRNFIYRMLNGEESVLRKFFPKREILQKQFPWVKKYPFLTGIAFVCRPINRVWQNITKKQGVPIAEKQDSSVSEMIERRFDVMEKLDMIDRR